MDEPAAKAVARILLVDDEPDQVEMYRYALEGAGFGVIAAATGGDAVDQARQLAPDLIVLDIRLPDMSGWDVCARLKEDPRTLRIPIVILTAAASPTLARDAAGSGCAAFLVKPCYPEELIASIRGILASL